MKSGDFSKTRDKESDRKAFGDIRDPHFEQHTFRPRPALVAKEPVNGQRMWKDYRGGPYDATKFDLAEGMWDHEHCSVCWFTIKDGHTYWEDGNHIKILCDACHEAFTQT